MAKISGSVDGIYGILWEPSFIQIGQQAIAIHTISSVEFGGDQSVHVFGIGDLKESYWVFRGPAAAAFLNWWETKASVNVLYTEPEEPTDESLDLSPLAIMTAERDELAQEVEDLKDELGEMADDAPF